MRSTRVRMMAWSGAALALLLAVALPGSPTNVGSGHVAFAQGTGQPSADNEEDGDEGAGQAPNQYPAAPTATPAGPAQQAGSQQGTGVLITILQSPSQLGSAIDEGDDIEEGDDIDEGLSNQRHDPDD